MPTFGDAKTIFENADQGIILDLRSSSSLTGKIPEALRTAPGVFRSSHPFSSVCAWGRQARAVTEGHASDPGITHAASPIGKLWALGGKVVGLGVTLGPVSFYHVVEDTWDGFPLPVYLKERPITYIDADGKTVTRNVRRFDPVVARTRIDHPEGAWIRERLTEHMRRKGIYRAFRYGEADAWVMEAKPFYDEMKRLAQKGITIYLTQAEWEKRNEALESW
jgi:aminoglycoside N3'-acetyltransferase